ncbi:MAG: 5-formyltetrahydrofolate cyclo-ligase, partial [Gammaproteobacteria bacterium]|nr:5-formyltetrahydrofolate cyclo-ligase [Gammaproteobacteria bacterium]
LIEYFFQSSVQVYLPKVYEDGSNQLQFLHYHPKSKMQNNRFGIPEPVTEDKIDLQNIDLLLMPLTAFDLSGNRIGMGGGYYDRTLSKLFNKKPLLVGIAYDFQQVERCPVESFDQPLQMILTPTRTVAFNH